MNRRLAILERRARIGYRLTLAYEELEARSPDPKTDAWLDSLSGEDLEAVENDTEYGRRLSERFKESQAGGGLVSDE